MSALRLASRIALEDLETNHSQQTLQSHPRQLSQERSPAQESRLPREHFSVGQILYAKDVYKDYPAWKRWVANHVHLPLFRFCHKVLGLYPPTGQRPDGTYIFAAQQGCFLTQAEADEDARRYPHGYVVPNPLGRSLTADIPEQPSSYIPNKEGPAICTPLMEVQDELRKLKADVRSLRLI